MANLIALVGFKSSGKNTAAAAFYPYGFVPFSFADALKDALAAIFCWDRALLEGITEASRAWRERIDTWWADKLGIPHFSPRWAMENVGTQIMRRHLHHDIWVFNVERRLMQIDAPIVLIDARFPNEIALAHHHGGRVIRVKRGADPEWMNLAITANHNAMPMMRDYARNLLLHRGVPESEFAWIGDQIDDTIINDDSVAQLQAKMIGLIVGSNQQTAPSVDHQTLQQ